MEKIVYHVYGAYTGLEVLSGRESSKKGNIGMMPTPMVVPRMTPVRCPATRPIRVVGTTMGLGVFPLADYTIWIDLGP